METETQRKIDETVRRILEESDMDQLTESKIRKQASQELALDLNKPPFKAFVNQVVESFIEQQQRKQEQQENDDEGNQEREYDDNGDLVICRLSHKRKVTVQEFKGKPLVSLREFFTKEGKELPTSKGISLTEEQWSVFKKNVPAIEKAIQKMESRIN
ncbi:putative transcription factor ssDNA-binding-TF family [Rosa chinensis]|uniref:Putative transcription factor ssDNA-binding-TF family n=1 Tax=Rosa chinensis TaxID=74649 RepID=A0A2P6P5Z9_ROSCH|nr:RNA polymerase II transcriptional coactivator KELP [Rosa chinensis]PRQ17361.1 putative transcription factor ssDNA-binding-TF family [Rosa chinensis]